MKLEQKHLASYLPYGLKIQGQTHEEIAELSALSKYGINIKDRSFQYGEWADIFDIKPILRPLSDLTKEIEIDGEKFVPYEKCKSVVNESQWIKICNTIDINGGEYSNICDMPYWWVNKLFEWHFDVFGLIEKGLAVDINTL